jgi:hypothetical protein
MLNMVGQGVALLVGQDMVAVLFMVVLVVE